MYVGSVIPRMVTNQFSLGLIVLSYKQSCFYYLRELFDYTFDQSLYTNASYVLSNEKSKYIKQCIMYIITESR